MKSQIAQVVKDKAARKETKDVRYLPLYFCAPHSSSPDPLSPGRSRGRFCTRSIRSLAPAHTLVARSNLHYARLLRRFVRRNKRNANAKKKEKTWTPNRELSASTIADCEWFAVVLVRACCLLLWQRYSHMFCSPQLARILVRRGLTKLEKQEKAGALENREKALQNALQLAEDEVQRAEHPDKPAAKKQETPDQAALTRFQSAKTQAENLKTIFDDMETKCGTAYPNCKPRADFIKGTVTIFVLN